MNFQWRAAVLAVTCLTISACSSVPMFEEQDGAPSGYVDVSRIPDASPKYEPYSKYGNPSSYEVFGKTYYVQESSANHVERGIASWYGTKFHGKRTSSGEPYDMYAMTAAHKTLPVPTYAEVTNLENGRKVIVKINDRGPFHEGRIVDLSYAAAIKLGVNVKGTAQVELRTITMDTDGVMRMAGDPALEGGAVAMPLQKSEPVAILPATDIGAGSSEGAPATSEDLLYVQVASFSDRDNMRGLINRLLDATAEPIQINQGRTAEDVPVYRVRVGPVKDRETATVLANQLDDLGIAKPIIVVD